MTPLTPWMSFVLRFGGTYNILAGVAVCSLYHEGFKLLGVQKPELILPVQLVGLFVALFGVGYWLVALHPVENRNLLMLGFWSKALGSALGIYYTLTGALPMFFLVVLFFADIIYLPPFYIVMRRLYRIAGEGAGEG